MIEEIVKPKQVQAEEVIKPLTIRDQQEFKIQVILEDSHAIRDEFTGAGQESYDETYQFAQKICQIYPGSRIRVYLKSKINTHLV